MTITHEGLWVLHKLNDPVRLPAGPEARFRTILFRLQEARCPGSADASGVRLHPPKGTRARRWGVRVSGKWCVVFHFA